MHAMKVFRRVRRMYRCRFLLRFAVLIALSLLFAIEVVKYKDRRKNSESLPNSSRETKYHPRMREHYQTQHGEIKKSRISLSEGLGEVYRKDALDDENNILDTRIGDHDDVTMEEDHGDKENKADDVYEEDEEDSVDGNNMGSKEEPTETEEGKKDEVAVNTTEKQNEEKELEKANKPVEKAVKNENWNNERNNQTVEEKENEEVVEEGEEEEIEEEEEEDEEEEQEEEEKAAAKEAGSKIDKLYFNDLDDDEIKDEEEVIDEETRNEEQQKLSWEEEDTKEEIETNKEVRDIYKPKVIKNAQSQRKKFIDQQGGGMSRDENHLNEDRGHIRNMADHKAEDNDLAESEVAKENGGKRDTDSSTTRTKTVEEKLVNVNKNTVMEKKDFQRMDESGFLDGNKKANDNAGIRNLAKFNDSLHFEETGRKSVNMTEKLFAKEYTVNSTNVRSKKGNAKAKGLDHFKETFEDNLRHVQESRIMKSNKNGMNGSSLISKEGKMDARTPKQNKDPKNETGRKNKDRDYKESETEKREMEKETEGNVIGKDKRNKAESKFESKEKESAKDSVEESKEGNILSIEQPTISEDLLRRRQEERKQVLNTFCHKHPKYRNPPPKSDMRHLVVIDEARIIYCSIPKVASTEWREALAVYHRPDGRVQGKQAQNRTLWKHMNEYSNRNVTEKIQHYYKFLFVREPFERLLSAYKSKFLAKNELYHRTFGREIIKKFRENATEHAKNSGDDVTFLEFVKHVAFAEKYEEHWRPYYQLCHACSVDYNFIGHLETIDEDAPFLVKEARIDDRVTFKSRRRSRTSSDLLSYYSQIPFRFLQRLEYIYLKDFEMFGYPFPGPLKSLFKTNLLSGS